MAQEPIGPAEGEALRRLRTLAAIGACAAHEWYFDAALNIDEVPPNGHVNDGSSEFGFDTCPHPDCVLVRAPLSGPVDASGEPVKAAFVDGFAAGQEAAASAGVNHCSYGVEYYWNRRAAAVPSSPAQDRTPSLQLQAFGVTVKPLPPSSPVADSATQDYQAACEVLPDSLGRPLAARIQLVLDNMRRESHVGCELRRELDGGIERDAKAIEQQWPDAARYLRSHTHIEDGV